MPNMMRTIVVIGFVVLLLGGGRASAQDSEALYTQKCAKCHGKDGSGHTSAASKLAVPDLRAKRIVEMKDAEIYDSIANGSKHKEYPHAFLHIGMKEEEIQGLVKYIRTLQSSSQPGTTKGTGKP